MRPCPTCSDDTHLTRTAGFWRRGGLAPTLTLLMLGACGGESEHYAPPAIDEPTVRSVEVAELAPVTLGEAGAAPGTCATGDARECKVMLSQHGNIVNCFVGVQICENEAWGPCQSASKL